MATYQDTFATLEKKSADDPELIALTVPEARRLLVRPATALAGLIETVAAPPIRRTTVSTAAPLPRSVSANIASIIRQAPAMSGWPNDEAARVAPWMLDRSW